MLFLEFSFDIRICDDERVIVRFPSNEMRERRNRGHNLVTTAKQAAMVWACVVKRR